MPIGLVNPSEQRKQWEISVIRWKQEMSTITIRKFNSNS